MLSKINNTAVKLARRVGLINVTLSDLCSECGVSTGRFYGETRATFPDFINGIYQSVPGLPLDTPGVSPARSHSPSLRREQIVAAGLKLAGVIGYHRVTHAGVAELCGVSRALVGTYFSIDSLKDAIVSLAVDREDIPVITQAYGSKHSAVSDLPDSIRYQIMKYLLEG